MNILFNDKVRSKRKSFFGCKPYYENDKISQKEKVYTFLYNMERTGLTTQGELDWSERMMKTDINLWLDLEESFRADYREYLKTK